MELYLRLIVEIGEADAAEFAGRLKRRLEDVVANASLRVCRPYWKLPGSQEVCFSLRFSSGAVETLSEVARCLGTGWAHPNVGEAIWSRGPETCFVESLVEWAHLELVN